jgi:hypothetical protein
VIQTSPSDKKNIVIELPADVYNSFDELHQIESKILQRRGKLRIVPDTTGGVSR